MLRNKAFKEKRKGVGGMWKEKSSRRPLNKEDSAQIASERPTSQRGAPNGGKTSRNSEDVVRARERRRQSGSSLPCCWGPLSISSALRIAVRKVFCRACPAPAAHTWWVRHPKMSPLPTRSSGAARRQRASLPLPYLLPPCTNVLKIISHFVKRCLDVRTGLLVKTGSRS